MKTISLEEAYSMLEQCAAIVVDDAVMYPSLWELNGNDNNEFLYLSWTDGDHREFHLKFVEGDNREVEVSGSSLFLADTEYKKTELTQINILQAKELE